jgi:tetratricopeptide (TPR) repeat protein
MASAVDYLRLNAPTPSVASTVIILVQFPALADALVACMSLPPARYESNKYCFIDLRIRILMHLLRVSQPLLRLSADAMDAADRHLAEIASSHINKDPEQIDREMAQQRRGWLGLVSVARGKLLLMRGGSLDDAVSYFNNAIKFSENTFMGIVAHFHMGQIYFWASQEDAAMNFFAHATKVAQKLSVEEGVNRQLLASCEATMGYMFSRRFRSQHDNGDLYRAEESFQRARTAVPTPVMHKLWELSAKQIEAIEADVWRILEV